MNIVAPSSPLRVCFSKIIISLELQFLHRILLFDKLMSFVADARIAWSLSMSASSNKLLFVAYVFSHKKLYISSFDCFELNILWTSKIVVSKDSCLKRLDADIFSIISAILSFTKKKTLEKTDNYRL